MTGWVSFFAGFSAPIAAAALAFSDYLGYFFPALQPGECARALRLGRLDPPIRRSAGGGCALVAVFTVLNFLGVQRVARVAERADRRKVLVLLAFIVLGVHHRQRRLAAFRHDRRARRRRRRCPRSSPSACSGSTSPIAAGTRPPTWPRSCDSPRARCPSRWPIGTVLVTALYLALNLVFIYAAPLEEMKGEIAVGALAASRLFGPEIAGMFSALMALVADVDGERDGHHRPARLLRDGEERSVSRRRRRRCIRAGTRRWSPLSRRASAPC